MMREDCKKSFFVLFDRSGDALRGLESFLKHSHKVIVALTVKEILDAQIAKKPVCPATKGIYQSEFGNWQRGQPARPGRQPADRNVGTHRRKQAALRGSNRSSRPSGRQPVLPKTNS
jgi:hypothetical protein